MSDLGITDHQLLYAICYAWEFSVRSPKLEADVARYHECFKRTITDVFGTSNMPLDDRLSKTEKLCLYLHKQRLSTHGEPPDDARARAFCGYGLSKAVSSMEVARAGAFAGRPADPKYAFLLTEKSAREADPDAHPTTTNNVESFHRTGYLDLTDRVREKSFATIMGRLSGYWPDGTAFPCNQQEYGKSLRGDREANGVRGRMHRYICPKRTVLSLLSFPSTIMHAIIFSIKELCIHIYRWVFGIHTYRPIPLAPGTKLFKSCAPSAR